jgi:hypothetical protein
MCQIFLASEFCIVKFYWLENFIGLNLVLLYIIHNELKLGFLSTLLHPTFKQQTLHSYKFHWLNFFFLPPIPQPLNSRKNPKISSHLNQSKQPKNQPNCFHSSSTREHSNALQGATKAKTHVFDRCFQVVTMWLSLNSLKAGNGDQNSAGCVFTRAQLSTRSASLNVKWEKNRNRGNYRSKIGKNFRCGLGFDWVKVGNVE